ncbi:MAG: acetyl-CoA carboxylase biotin carboxyl carrier protein [Candidatus Omnitrophica bacterium]|nr:acetyl-CoA carboxylase biotin carboxyl carrier protein [Candidatus Omnitrophota bacterium]
MDLKKLNKFIKFMDDNNLSELEIEEGKQRIRLKKYEGKKPQISYQKVPEKPSQESKKEKDKGLIEIKSPMVGTFYRSASPGAKPYVEIDKTVEEEDVICIIEAMKVMNEVKAETKGKIVQILVEDGQSVEFGQTLFTVKP